MKICNYLLLVLFFLIQNAYSAPKNNTGDNPSYLALKQAILETCLEEHSYSNSGHCDPTELENSTELCVIAQKLLEQEQDRISFDCENILDERWARFDNWENPKSFFGYHSTTKSKIPFLGQAAGGDWEMPVAFILYLANNKLKAYVPNQGNVFNRTTKFAFGNDETEDINDVKKYYGYEFLDCDNDYAECTINLDKFRYYPAEMLKEFSQNIN